MKIYTKGGDRGTTSLVQTKNISKSDDRVQCIGAMEELISQIGLVKTMLTDAQETGFLEKIQRTLITVMAGVADPFKKDYHIDDSAAQELEAEIDRLELLFQRPKEFILPGTCRLSAQIDVARTVARRAERSLALVSVRYGADNGSKKYMNRLADYLYILARYHDHLWMQEKGTAGFPAAAAGNQEQGSPEGTAADKADKYGNAADRAVVHEKAADQAVLQGYAAEKTGFHTNVSDRAVVSADASDGAALQEHCAALVREALKQMGVIPRINLNIARNLADRIEAEAARRGLRAVIAICTPEGNPVLVHAMDGAFLVSFDVATKKAYTSVAVKMSTQELSRLAQPGQTFYGVDKMDGGKIVVFGGGIPLKYGDTIIGGLGISGGTGEEDHSLAEYGASVLKEVMA